MTRFGERIEELFIRLKALAGIIDNSLADQLYIADDEQLRKFIAKTGGTQIPTGKSLYDLLRGGANIVCKVAPALSGAITVTSGGTNWTYGSWSEILASTAEDEKIWVVGILMRGVSAGWYQVDVGIGAGGSESRIVTAVHRIDSGAGYISVYPIPIPRELAANTRISIRAACDSASKDIGVYIMYVTGALG